MNVEKPFRLGVFKFWGKRKISGYKTPNSAQFWPVKASYNANYAAKTARGAFVLGQFQALATQEMRLSNRPPNANAPFRLVYLHFSHAGIDSAG